MWKSFVLLVTIASVSSLASPGPLGLQIGVSTAEDVAATRKMTLVGKNRITGGNVYLLNMKSDLGESMPPLVIFDEHGRLAAVLIKREPLWFSMRHDALRKEWKLVEKQTNSPWDMSALFSNGNAYVSLQLRPGGHVMREDYVGKDYYL